MSANSTKAKITGRILRFALGIFFVTEVWPVYWDVTWEGVLLRLGWATGPVVFYLLLHFIISKFITHLNPMIGAVLALAPLLSVFFMDYGGPAATGALTFLAVSLILAAFRADSGCEVMSLPALFTGKHTHLACMVFSPIDWFEGRSSRD